MQIVLVIFIVSCASIYIIWKAYQYWFSKKQKCDSCSFSGEKSKEI